MGNLCSCCFPNEGDSDSSRAPNETAGTPLRNVLSKKKQPLTEKDYSAQSAAAAAAEARQQKFESSAVGRAAYKAETAVREKPKSFERPDTSKDWLS